MSGGSMNYVYCQIEEECVGHMGDHELDDLMKDVAKLVHDREWCLSGDTCEETYQKTVKEFKRKWFKSPRADRLYGYIDDVFNKSRSDCMAMIGEVDGTPYDGLVKQYGNFVSKSEAANILQVNRATVYNMVADGRLQTGYGGKQVVTRSIVDYVRSRGGKK